MNFEEFVRLVKDYEGEIRNSLTYIQKINNYIIGHPESIGNIKTRLITDQRFERRFLGIIDRYSYYPVLNRIKCEYEAKHPDKIFFLKKR